MSFTDRALSVLLGLAMIGLVAWGRRHAEKTGELLGKGSPIYREENPRMFRFFYKAYGVLLIFGAVVTFCLAVGLGPF